MISHAELAPAVKLIVEGVFLQQFISPLLQSALAPISILKRYSAYLSCRPFACFVDLVEGFPATRSQGSGKRVDAQFLTFFRSTEKPYLESFEASPSPFRFFFKSCHPFQPFFVIVVIVVDVYSQFLSILSNLILTDKVFFFGKDIWIAIVKYRTYVVVNHPFQNGTGTWGATTMQQYCLHQIV